MDLGRSAFLDDIKWPIADTSMMIRCNKHAGDYEYLIRSLTEWIKGWESEKRLFLEQKYPVICRFRN